MVNHADLDFITQFTVIRRRTTEPRRMSEWFQCASSPHGTLRPHLNPTTPTVFGNDPSNIFWLNCDYHEACGHAACKLDYHLSFGNHKHMRCDVMQPHHRSCLHAGCCNCWKLVLVETYIPFIIHGAVSPCVLRDTWWNILIYERYSFI